MITITVQGTDLKDIQDKIRAMFPVEPKAVSDKDPRQMEMVFEPRQEKVHKKRGPKPKEPVIPTHSKTEELIREMAEESKPLLEERKLPAISGIESEISSIEQLVPAKHNKATVHAILQRVNVEKGLTKARDIILSFGAMRLSDIKEHQYDAFVKKCEDVLNA